DLIQPYRLEMKTKLENAYGKDLYKFWGQKITNYLNQNLSEYDFVINLASNEYSKAIDRKKLKAKVVDIDFKHIKGDKISTIAIYAKLARGLFADYIIKNKIDTVDKLRKIVLDNYNLDLEKSNDYNLVFVKDVTIK
ncbi:peroxide stress protein YaaA, partial [bacterium]|nr:peroxide stress protein YaaA [bacterium]